MKNKSALTIFVLCLAIAIEPLTAQTQSSIDYSIKFSEEISDQVQKDGRLFIFFSNNSRREPRSQTWPTPGMSNIIFAKNYSDIKPQSSFEIGSSETWVSTSDMKINAIKPGRYYIQALWDQDTSESRISAPGNLYSDVLELTISDENKIDLVIAKSIPERSEIEHELVRWVDMKSDTLSSWWGKDIFLKASILLPSNYDAKKSYAIRYNVAGYGGRYTRISRLVRSNRFMDWWASEEAPEVITVFLDGEGPFGDSYQMDSENSGPYGYALINELIPFIEKQYRGTTDPLERFVDGCSTGGWVSLGLQLYYPDVFNGVFSYSPDAIEFENYQLINIYKDENAFVNEYGYDRPVWRETSGEPVMSLRDFINYENVLGYSNTYVTSGGQFSAHTALYSPKGDDGLPKPLFDPESGDIDKEVADHWKKYDFKLYASENWSELGPAVAGKIYLWMGDMDNFYLNPASRSFAQWLESTDNPKSDAVIEFTATAGHCTQFSNTKVLEQIKKRLSDIRN